MKNKIYQLAKEEFEYTSATLILQEEWIRKETEEGKNAKGTLFIRNSDNRRMKGILYTTSPFIHLKTTTFSGTEALVDYELFSLERKAGELLSGEIYLITSCGEYRIGVELVIKENEQAKKAGNLFRLANLARSDWGAAVEQYKHLYAKRTGGGPASQELEEFLIDGSKKWKVQIRTDASSFFYDEVTDSFAESLILKKDNWGYLKIDVWSDAEFLQPEHKVIWSDNFIGDEYMLEFLIRKEKLHDGKNYGKLYIKTIHQLLTVEVCAICQSRKEEKLKQRKRKEAILALVHNYLNYRCGLIEKKAYTRESLLFRREHQSLFSEEMNQFLEISFMALDGQKALAEELLKDVPKQKGRLEKAAVAYLSYLSSEAPEKMEENALLIEKLWKEEMQNGRLLWFFLQTSTELSKNPQRKFEIIEEYNKKQKPSNLLHIELIEALNQQPTILKHLTPSLVRAFNWGIRMNLISAILLERYIFLATHEELRPIHALIGLKSIYHQEEDEEVLQAILAIMVKNNCKGSPYFSWYEKGILKQLRVAGLYEAYLSSAEEQSDLVIPKPVLAYFADDVTLPRETKEFLYAYIVKHKDSDEETYRSFCELIEAFALQSLSEGVLNVRMAIIYPEILKIEKLDDFYLKKLSQILFRQKLVCKNVNITGVYIQHKELEKEEYYPVCKGEAEVYLFTENPRISFVALDGARYGSSIEHTLEPYLDLSAWHKECYKVDAENVHLLLRLYERIEKYQKFDENANEIRHRVQDISGIKKEYEAECRTALIYQYFDKMEEEPLKEELLKISAEWVKEEDRPKLVDYCILQGLNERAYELIKLWNYKGVPMNRLLRLASRLLEKTMEKDDNLLRMCGYLLESGRCNHTTLTYLVWYYEGLLGQMVRIWEKAQENGVETWPLEERILVQLLFTEGYVVKHFKIFQSYYRKKKDVTLIRAYLNFYSYRYFVKGSAIQEEFFHLLPTEIKQEYSQIMALAYLQEKGRKKELTLTEQTVVRELLYPFFQKNQIFSFFKSFAGKLSMEEGVLNRTFIEYRTLPERRVSLAYRIAEMEDFKSVPMLELGYGIYSTDFLLFADEEIQYYITEYADDEEIITESYTVMEEDKSKELENSTFGLLGAILTARRLKDDAAMEELMEEYILQEYRKEKLFTML